MSISDYYNMFTVLYWLLPLLSQVVECLGFACCQWPLQIRITGVALRLTLFANGVTSLYRGYSCMIQFLYSCFSSFQIFCSRYLMFLAVFPYSLGLWEFYQSFIGSLCCSVALLAFMHQAGHFKTYCKPGVNDFLHASCMKVFAQI